MLSEYLITIQFREFRIQIMINNIHFEWRSFKKKHFVPMMNEKLTRSDLWITPSDATASHYTSGMIIPLFLDSQMQGEQNKSSAIMKTIDPRSSRKYDNLWKTWDMMKVCKGNGINPAETVWYEPDRTEIDAICPSIGWIKA